MAAGAPIAGASADTTVRLGMLRTLSPAPLYIAQERGYFRDEEIETVFRFFEAAQPIAAAAVSDDIDVGITALTGGFFNLAEKGMLKVIGGGLHEQKGYEGSAILVSNKAYEAGLTIGRQARRPQLRHHAIRLVVPLHARPHRGSARLRSENRPAARRCNRCRT